MRLAFAAIIIGFVHTEDTEDYDYYGSVFDDNTEYDEQWKKDNCVMECHDGNCVSKEQKCDGHRDCPRGEDELDCPVNDSRNHGRSRDGNSTAPATPSPFRGRFPSFYAPQVSAYRGFNEPAYAVFQRRNRRILQHVTGNSNDDRLDQMMKMLFYMTEGKLSMANFMGYGCHCNVDGSGHGVSHDEIDSACSRNAGCRKCAATDFSCNPNTAYLVNGAISGRPDGIACINRPDTCARALCECDMQLMRDIMSNQRDWNESFHTYHGFDQSSCSSFNNMDLGRSLQQSGAGGKSSAEGECCGQYPNRQPINGSGRGCCGEKTYNSGHFECCADSDIVPIGSC